MELNENDFMRLETIVELLNCLDASESSKDLSMIIRKIKRDDDNKCAISVCNNNAIADILHDDNSGAIPLCAKHLISYTKDLKNYLLTQF